MITTQTADNALKSYYLNVISDTLDKTANPFLAAIKKTTADVWGRDVRKTVRIGLNGGVGAGSESGNLPKANGNRYAQLVGSLKNLYGTIEITDKAIRSSQNNEGAFVNLLNDEMDGLVKSASYNFGRMLFGDGSGTLATVVTAPVSASSTPAVFDTLQYVTEGMTVDVHSASGTVKKSGVTIERLDRTNKYVTFSENVTLAKSDFIVMQNSYNLELTGLKAIFAEEGTLYGLNKADNSWLVPSIVKSVGAISETVVQKAIDKAEETYGGKIDLIVCSLGVRRAMLQSLAGFPKYEPLKSENGFSTFAFSGVPVIADRFCPEGCAYLINTDDFALHQLCDWQWLEGEDGKILKQIAGKPVFTATLVKYAELMCYRPCGQVMMTGITED